MRGAPEARMIVCHERGVVQVQAALGYVGERSD